MRVRMWKRLVGVFLEKARRGLEVLHPSLKCAGGYRRGG